MTFGDKASHPTGLARLYALPVGPPDAPVAPVASHPRGPRVTTLFAAPRVTIRHTSLDVIYVPRPNRLVSRWFRLFLRCTR